MFYTKEQKQSAYKKLPPEIQDLVMSNETTELVTNALKEVGLSEEQQNLADSEILYTFFCLQSLDDTINNISKISGKNTNDLSKLKSTIQDNILDKYKIDIKEFIDTNKSKPVAPTSVPEIPPANLPMIEEGEAVHEARPLTPERSDGGRVPHVQPARQDLAGSQIKSEPKVSLPDYRYEGGKDPYREPLK